MTCPKTKEQIRLRKKLYDRSRYLKLGKEFFTKAAMIWRKNNRLRHNANAIKWRLLNPEKSRKSVRESFAKRLLLNPNLYSENYKKRKERDLSFLNKRAEADRKFGYSKRYKQNNRDKVNARARIRCSEKRKLDPNFRIGQNLRRCVNIALHKAKGKKTKNLEQLFGCNIFELKKYLESKFKIGMSWENHSINGWHIDHIIPCSRFDLTKIEDRMKCFNYKNMQPLWVADHRQKGRDEKH